MFKTGIWIQLGQCENVIGLDFSGLNIRVHTSQLIFFEILTLYQAVLNDCLLFCADCPPRQFLYCFVEISSFGGLFSVLKVKTIIQMSSERLFCAPFVFF